MASILIVHLFGLLFLVECFMEGFVGQLSESILTDKNRFILIFCFYQWLQSELEVKINQK